MPAKLSTSFFILGTEVFLEIKSRDDVIVFKDQKHYVVKRIQEIKGEKFLVKGDNKEDSKEYGWIEKKKIIGKVILKLS